MLFFTGEMNHPTLSRARRGLVRMSHYFCFRQNWKRNEFNCKEFTTKKLERKTRWRRKGIRSGAIHKLHNASLDNGSITLVNKCNLRPTKIHYKHQRDWFKMNLKCKSLFHAPKNISKFCKKNKDYKIIFTLFTDCILTKIWQF